MAIQLQAHRITGARVCCRPLGRSDDGRDLGYSVEIAFCRSGEREEVAVTLFCDTSADATAVLDGLVDSAIDATAAEVLPAEKIDEAREACARG